MARFVSILGKITSKLGRAFGRSGKPPTPLKTASGGGSLRPYKVQGFGGVAAGSRSYRRRLMEEGQAPFTEEELRQHENVSGEKVEDFILNGGILAVNSSNVSFARYLAEENKMIVVFHGGKGYEYSSVSKQEALGFAMAQSKGGWVWDVLRVRGSRTAHKKPYRRMFFTDLPTPGKVASKRGLYRGFVQDGDLLPVQSGGVEFAHYLAQEHILVVALQNGQSFEYANVSPAEATQFATSRDKGKWIQNVANKKPYFRYAPGSSTGLT